MEDDDLETLRARADANGEAISASVKRAGDGLRIVKLLMIIGGGALATGMQFADGWGVWQVLLGVTGAVAALVGGVLVAFVEKDAPHELDRARQALDVAQLYLSQRDLIFAEVMDLEERARWQRNLHGAAKIMRETIEQAITRRQVDERALLSDLITLPEVQLRGAMNFNADELWIVSIFKREVVDGKSKLVKLVEQRARRNEEQKEIRSWGAGEGFAGAALISGGEIVLPDLADPEVSRLIYISDDNRKGHEDDHKRYRSCAAVAVNVGAEDEPWGVVTVGTDRAERFHYELDEPGWQHAEAVRLLAGMVALAVGAQHIMAMSALPTEPDPATAAPPGSDISAAIEQEQPLPERIQK